MNDATCIACDAPVSYLCDACTAVHVDPVGNAPLTVRDLAALRQATQGATPERAAALLADVRETRRLNVAALVGRLAVRDSEHDWRTPVAMLRALGYASLASAVLRKRTAELAASAAHAAAVVAELTAPATEPAVASPCDVCEKSGLELLDGVCAPCAGVLAARTAEPSVRYTPTSDAAFAAVEAAIAPTPAVPAAKPAPAAKAARKNLVWVEYTGGGAILELRTDGLGKAEFAAFLSACRACPTRRWVAKLQRNTLAASDRKTFALALAAHLPAGRTVTVASTRGEMAVTGVRRAA